MPSPRKPPRSKTPVRDSDAKPNEYDDALPADVNLVRAVFAVAKSIDRAARALECIGVDMPGDNPSCLEGIAFAIRDGAEAIAGAVPAALAARED